MEMTPPNLAIVFGPNLLKPKKVDLKQTLFLDKHSEIVRNCIEFYEEVFVVTEKNDQKFL
jgi:hypothetical protein